jgi:hypothetical protein
MAVNFIVVGNRDEETVMNDEIFDFFVATRQTCGLSYVV